MSSENATDNRQANGRRHKRPTPPVERLLAEAVPPQDLEAERAVLGSILRDNRCFSDVSLIVNADSFYSDRHKVIFDSMARMIAAEKPVDVFTLGEELSKAGKFMELGGAPTLAALFDDTLTAANSTHYAAIVRERAISRGVIHVFTEGLRDAYSGMPPEDLLEFAEKEITSLATGASKVDAVQAFDVVRKLMDELPKRKERDSSQGVKTGFFALDDKIWCLRNGNLIIVGARPSIGKTSFAASIVGHVAHEYEVIFVTLEQSKDELAERMVSLKSDVPLNLLQQGLFNETDELQRIASATNDVGNLKVRFIDVPGATIGTIVSACRREKMRRDVRLIVVDYLGLIEVDEKRKKERHEQVAEISRRLKSLARELLVPVMALAQLNREVESRASAKPKLADLRDSGAIEQDADLVLLLHRPEFYNPSDRPGEADVIVAKQRNGPIGDVRLGFRKEFTRFENAVEIKPWEGGGF